MSYNNPRIDFRGINLWDLNPNEIALKNDFMDNLLGLAYDVTNVIGQIVHPIKVIRGMTSLSKLKSEIVNPGYIEKRFTSANALEITWDKFDKEDTKTVLRNVLGSFENQLSILIKDQSIVLYRSERRAIEEELENETRTFFVLE